MLVAASIPILPYERRRSPIGAMCRSTLNRIVAHLSQAGAHVTRDSDAYEDAMDGGPPPSSHPTRQGRSSTHEVGESCLRQVECPPWMDMLKGEFTMLID